MSFDTFKGEQIVLARAEAVLANTAEADLREEFKALFKAYGKLLKTTKRLVVISDLNEERLITSEKETKRAQAEMTQIFNAAAGGMRVVGKDLILCFRSCSATIKPDFIVGASSCTQSSRRQILRL